LSLPNAAYAPVLDHIIVTATTLADAIDALERLTGVRAAMGGEHPQHGTANALLSMGGSYLELFTRARDAAAGGSFDELNLIDFAMRIDGLGSVAGRAAKAGLGVDRIDGSRLTPAGDLLRWQAIQLTGHDFTGALPFFIDWGATPHPAWTAPLGISEPVFSVVHPQGDALRGLYRLLGIGIEVTRGDRPSLSLRAMGRSGPFTLTGDARGWQAVANG
jgi:hypothetical protein